MTHTHFSTEGTFPCLDPDRQKRYFHENRQSGFVRHSSTISRNSACCRWTRQSGRSACGCCKIRADRVKTHLCRGSGAWAAKIVRREGLIPYSGVSWKTLLRLPHQAIPPYERSKNRSICRLGCHRGH